MATSTGLGGMSIEMINDLAETLHDDALASHGHDPAAPWKRAFLDLRGSIAAEAEATAGRISLFDRLNDQLNDAQAEIESLREQIQTLENERPWTAHTTRTVDDQPSLPVPRLELRMAAGELGRGYNWHCEYALVYRHFLGHVVWVPLGSTLIGGGREPATGYLPFRDSAHIRNDARQLNLPAFLVNLDGSTEPIDTTKRHCMVGHE